MGSQAPRVGPSTSALAISRPATRCTNSGSSRTSSIDGSYDERAVPVAVVRGSMRHKGNLVGGLEAPFSGPEDKAPGVRLFNGVQPAKEERRQRTTADPVSTPPRAQARDSSAPDQERPALHAAAPGAAGLPVTDNGGRAAPHFTPPPPLPRA